MTTIAKMTGATETKTERVVVVPPNAARLFAKADIKPPDEGQFLSVADVDEKLSGAGFESHERIMAKRLLVRYGLMLPGQPPNLCRR
jgi:hypothetical protein